MRFQHIAEHIYSKPWLITPSAHASVVRLFESKFRDSAKFDLSAEDGLGTDALFVQREPASLDVNGIGHVYIKGVIGQGLSPLEKTCGNTDTRDVKAEIAALVAQGAKGILLCVDSPGGIITGTPELAEYIADVATEIPLFVFSDSQICSAAFWIAAGASKIICTSSAEIGSVGVYFPWIDKSVQWEEEGIKADPIINTGGRLKAIGFSPALSDEHRAQLQSYVDQVFGMFRTFVVNMRGIYGAVVPNSALQGQVFLGEDTITHNDAISNGLVDAIASEEDAYEMLLQEIEIETEPVPQQEAPENTNSEEQAPADPNTASSATS